MNTMAIEGMLMKGIITKISATGSIAGSIAMQMSAKPKPADACTVPPKKVTILVNTMVKNIAKAPYSYRTRLKQAVFAASLSVSII